MGATLAGPGTAAHAVTGDDGQVCAHVTPTGAPIEIARVVIQGYLQNGRHETDSFGLHRSDSGGYDGCSSFYIWGMPDVWQGTVHLQLIVNAKELASTDVDAGKGDHIFQSWSVDVPPTPPTEPGPPMIPCPPSC